MVEDGSNRESVIWLGVDAVITCSLSDHSTPLIHQLTSYHTLSHSFIVLLDP
jgi:hypothetical protein